MSQNAARDPWRIIDSDNEDEKVDILHTPVPFTTRPATPKYVPRPMQPKTPDWNPELNGERPFEKKNSNKKLPNEHENAGRISSSSSSDSSSRLNNRDNKLVTNTPESPPASPPVVNSSNFDLITLIQEDINKFIYTYIPKDYSSYVQCRLRRDKDGVQGGFFPTFYLHAERPGDGKKFFLLAARKIAKVNRQSHYLITTNVETLSEKSGGDGYVGKLRGNNVSGTEYTLYDNGLSPNKYTSNKQSTNRENLRRELAAIVYNTNILGFKGPRQVSAMLPQLGYDLRPTKDEDGILDQWRDRRLGYLIQLRNKSPKYNEDTKTYVLQFTGNRVAQPSVKNFQMVIINESHEEEVVMQFGRVDNDTFTCDYRYPLSAIQAFGIALSSFDSRLVRE